MLKYKLEHSDVKLINVHSEDSCKGRPCAIHNKTEHHMRGWQQHWRDDRGIIERICPVHSHGCPDPDQLEYWRIKGWDYEGVHGCGINKNSGNNCCSPWQIEDVDAAWIPGFKDLYAVTKDGRFWHLRTRVLPELTKTVNFSDCAMALLLTPQGTFDFRRADALVLSAFRGSEPNLTAIKHLNGDNSDNRLQNLVDLTK